MPVHASDRDLIARALGLAAAAVVRGDPNPTVGCLVVDDAGAVLGSGTSRPAGGAHAEVEALAEAGDRACGATAVVTLEPCAHTGRTPPCTDALLAAGVARVVVGVADPDPVAAGGAARLAAAGVRVDGPLAPDDPLARAIDAELAGFLARTLAGRPHVTLKLAQTVAGDLDAPDGGRHVTGPAARRTVHRLRARVDAVLVGSGTVLADDPALDAREVDAARQPRPVILDTRARTPTSARALRDGAVVVTAPDADPVRRAALTAAGARVLPAPRATGGLDLPTVLALLAAEGIASVLAEPGRRLAAALLDAGLVDRLVLHVRDGATPGSASVVPALVPPDGWRAVRVGRAGPDRVLELAPAHQARAVREAA